MVRVNRVIPAVLADVIRKAPLCDEKVDFAWRAAVGPAVERMTKVRLGADGLLAVTPATADWGREVTRSRALILARLESLLGPNVVTRIHVS